MFMTEQLTSSKVCNSNKECKYYILNYSQQTREVQTLVLMETFLH